MKIVGTPNGCFKADQFKAMNLEKIEGSEEWRIHITFHEGSMDGFYPSFEMADEVYKDILEQLKDA
jgi:hypothetical protein